MEVAMIDVGRLKARVLQKAWEDWLVGAKEWKTFLTLTYRDFKYHDQALKDWGFLIRTLNREVFTDRYTKKVGHSYFSYVMGIEEQKREVIHFHAIVDQPLNYQKIHDQWNFFNGFAWISQIRSREECVNYVCKYVMKGGEIYPYFAKKSFIPDKYPLWWF